MISLRPNTCLVCPRLSLSKHSFTTTPVIESLV